MRRGVGGGLWAMFWGGEIRGWRRRGWGLGVGGCVGGWGGVRWCGSGYGLVEGGGELL